MSIKIMTKVWEHSKQGGSQLLLLLAIADNANDAGFAWPGQEHLAKKIRMDKRSIPRLTKKLKEAKELFINNRGDIGRVTQYIVTIGMDQQQFAATIKTHMKYDEDQTKAALIWFKGGDKLGGRQSVTPDIAVSGGDDIAVSGGDDIAVSPEPSLPVNEPSLSPNGGNGLSTNGQTQPAKQIKPQLTDQQKNDLLVFGKHPDTEANAQFDTIQEITNAGWSIREPIILQGVAHYIEAVRAKHPNFGIPNNISIRKDWYKAIKGHLEDYRIDNLPWLYQQAIERHAEKRLKYSRPGSLTNTLTDVGLDSPDANGVVAWL